MFFYLFVFTMFSHKGKCEGICLVRTNTFSFIVWIRCVVSQLLLVMLFPLDFPEFMLQTWTLNTNNRTRKAFHCRTLSWTQIPFPPTPSTNHLTLNLPSLQFYPNPSLSFSHSLFPPKHPSFLTHSLTPSFTSHFLSSLLTITLHPTLCVSL